MTYEFCLPETVLKAHQEKWPDQQLVSSNDGKCIRSLEPLYIFSYTRPEVALLYQENPQEQNSNERFRSDY